MHHQRRILLWSLILATWSCRPAFETESREVAETRSPTARPEIVEALREDMEADRHPSDGGGQVRFADAGPYAVAGQPGSWSFVFTAGPLGIARDGWLFFQVPPFWGWSTPQVVTPRGMGFTEVSTNADGVVLEAATLDQQLLAIQIKGRDLRAEEIIRLHFGAGPSGALADRFAERRSCFYFAVDGDGDGVRSLLGEQPCLDVGPGPAARLRLTMPSTASPGATVEMSVAILDVVGNRVEDWTGTVTLKGPEGIQLPTRVEIAEEDRGVRKVEVEVLDAGVYRVTGKVEDLLFSETNPILVREAVERILWADLHGHSGFSDGTGTPKDYFLYARDVSGLDVVALTDHDHWGMQPLSIHPELWEEIRRETELFNSPNRFVTLLGYEWTSWIHGHRHVLYFKDQGRVLSSVDPEYESPEQLWAALRGGEALTFAHHSAGGPIATNWQIPPDLELEPVTEIVSVHGSSEAPDSFAPIYSSVPGNFVRDTLDRGYRLGFIGSGDGHDGHPGLAHLGSQSGGLAAIFSEDLSRSGVKTAIQERRVYATNGPRIILQAEFAGYPMGSIIDHRTLALEGSGQSILRVEAVGVTDLARIELIRSGSIAESVHCAGEVRCAVDLEIKDLSRNEYLYVRVVQVDGGTAWSSPFFAD